MYLIGGSGGIWYWISQWRGRTRIKVRLLGENYDIKTEPNVSVLTTVEIVNIGGSTTSVEPYISVTGISPKGEPRTFNLEIKGTDRGLAPHQPKLFEVTGICEAVFPFLWYKNYSFSLTKGFSAKLRVLNASGKNLGRVSYFVGKALFRLSSWRQSKTEAKGIPKTMPDAIDRSHSLILEFVKEFPYEVTDPADAEGKALRGFRIKVKNIGGSDLENCIAKLENINRTDGKEFRNLFLPVGLKTQHQRLENRQGGPFNLRSDEEKYIEIVYLNELDPGSEIALQYETNKYPNLIPRGDYVLSIGVYGGGPAVKARYRIFVDENGIFCFENYQ